MASGLGCPRRHLCWNKLSQALEIYISGQRICTAFDLTVLLLGIQEEEIVADTCKDTCTRMLSIVLFIIEQNWKHLK